MSIPGGKGGPKRPSPTGLAGPFAPKEIHAWACRLAFLDGLSGLVPKGKQESFCTLLQSELLPFWRDAQEEYLATRPVIARVAPRSKARDEQSALAASPARWFRLGDECHRGTMPGSLQKALRTLACWSSLDACWTKTARLLKACRLDGYEMRGGELSDVSWMRDVVTATLLSWMDRQPEALSGQDPFLCLPEEVEAALLAHWSGSAHLPSDLQAASSSAPLAGASQIGAFDAMQEQLGSRATDAAHPILVHSIAARRDADEVATQRETQIGTRAWHLTLPEYSPLEGEASYLSASLKHCERAIRNILVAKKKVAASNPLMTQTSAKREPAHFIWLALFQAGGLSRRQLAIDFRCNRYAIQTALESASKAIGLPLRAD